MMNKDTKTLYDFIPNYPKGSTKPFIVKSGSKNTFDKIDLGTGGVIVTAAGEKVDFVSRFFTPRATLLEDPVTGSAHCSLIPFWSSFLKKKKMEDLELKLHSISSENKQFEQYLVNV